MELRAFGRTGVQVSQVCLGAMMFGAMGNTDVDECVTMVHRALDAGVNMVDTADGYSRGESEEIVGRALAGRRDDVVLATKVYFPMGADPNLRGGSRRWITRAVEHSLRRLGTDHIDLYQLHRRDHTTDLEESLGAMSDLVRAGKVRMIGMSASPPEQIVEARWLAEQRRLVQVRSEQSIYNIFNRGIEGGVLPACQRYGIGVMVYGPLNGGWLTGKYRRGEATPADSRGGRATFGRERFDPELPGNRRKLELLDELRVLAEEAGLSLTHLAYGFAAEHPGVATVIIGPRTPAQLSDALAGAQVRLPADVLDRIDQLVPPATDVSRADTVRPEPHLEPSARRRPR